MLLLDPPAAVPAPPPAVGAMTSTTTDDTAVPRRALELAHELAVLAETDPDNLVLLAVRLALDVADARDVERARRWETAQAGLQVHGGDRGFWRRWADNRVSFAELQRRRAVPGPMATDGAR